MDLNVQKSIHSEALNREFEWLTSLIEARLSEKTWGISIVSDALSLVQAAQIDEHSSIGSFLVENEFSVYDRILMVLATAKHYQPSILRGLANSNEFGAKVDAEKGEAKPTLKTAIVLMAGFDSSMYNFFFKEFVNSRSVHEGVINLMGDGHNDEQSVTDELSMGMEFVQHFSNGGEFRPDKSSTFPAKLIKTSFSWDDLVVKHSIKKALQSVIDWIKYGKEILNEDNSSGKIGPSFPVLFYGPPGTGKTMAAGLIGKFTNKPVYRVDLSLITSKYVGETQKNLATLFNRAQNKNWILFFDEADALFGKRTGVKDAHDKFANQEMSYILQRIEEFSGVVILATNYSSNIDEAMTRRFQSKIFFGLPDAPERKLIWEKSIPAGYQFASNIKTELVAQNYNLTGANIRNIVKMLTVGAKSKNTHQFEASDIQERIMLELAKEGKTL